MLWDLVIVFLSASGVVLVVWCLLGALLHPVFDADMVTYLPVRGDGGKVEQSVRAYALLRSGRLSGGKLVLLDCGLNQQGRQRAEAVCRWYEWVSCCPATENETYIIR